MSCNGAKELREYLRRRNPAPNEQFDEFLAQVEVFFKLRVRAEQRFQKKPNTAKSRQGALPLDWKDIADLVITGAESPPENIVTQFARESLEVSEEVLAALRKVLVRERQKVSLGLVQQVDAQCLRWLTRQPGRDGVEKAGARQRILAVVRKENYDTLENRVLKDFLLRMAQETAIYLRKNETRFPEHEIIQRIRRLHGVCQCGVNEPLLEKVAELRELPIPNYVLRQERRYSKIWKAYVELIRQASVAERLWDRRNEVSAVLTKLRAEVTRQTDPRARFHSPLWFNPLDGRHELLDSPFYENEWTDMPQQGGFVNSQNDVVIDLAGGSLREELLIYGRHKNAKPYIQDYTKPSIEDRNTGRAFLLSELLQKKDGIRLRDFMEQLHARLGGERWFLLVPDHYDALWQEAIIKAIPLTRNRVFLVWRSIACAIGAMGKLRAAENDDDIVILDLLQDGQMQMTRLTLTRAESGKLVPQRKAYKHGEINSRYKAVHMSLISRKSTEERHLGESHDQFSCSSLNEADCLSFIGKTKHVLLVSEGHVVLPESILKLCCVVENHSVLENGVKKFAECLATQQIPYYDELEALSLIVQSDDENVFAKTLVEANEKWPGGSVMETPLLQRAAVLARGEDHMRLLLCLGEVTPESRLRIKRHDFGEVLEEDYAVNLAVRMMPGQGMAVVAVQADFLRHPIELDFLHGMSEKDERGRELTISTTEEEMLRSFPPDAPHVVADEVLWQQVSNDVKLWIRNSRSTPAGDWFAKAADLYAGEEVLPEGVTPIERLRRKNVFGNDPNHRFPTTDDFSTLFRKLKDAYEKSVPTSEASSTYAEVVRAIAWTYQSDNPMFMEVRKKCVERISKYACRQMLARPLVQEYTLCANLCNKIQEWKTLWAAIYLRLEDTSNDNSVEEELRLLYNLLQFHPTFLHDTELYAKAECWEMMKKLTFWYKRYNDDGPAGSRRIGYVLKCMLYLLRCRKFDGKIFVTRARDKAAHDIMRRCLATSPKALSKRDLHRVLCNYLDGRGTIAGLPTS